MSKYVYEAKDLQGKKIKGTLICKDEKSLNSIIREKGYFLTWYDLKAEISIFSEKVSKKDLSIFCKQLSSILECGIPIYEALDILQKQSKKKILNKSISKIKEEVIKGNPMSDGLKACNGVFPKLMINMVKISEESGNIVVILKELSAYLGREYRIRKKIGIALIYPSILLFLIMVLTLFLIVKVVPEFVTIFSSMKASIPAITNTIMKLSSFIRENYILLCLIPLILIICGIYVNRKNQFSLFKDKLKEILPFVRKLYSYVIEIRFNSIMSTLLESGITLFYSLELTKESIDNSNMQNKISDMIIDVKKGMSVTDSIRNKNVFSKLTISMLSIGETSGKLGEMLRKASEIMEEDFENQLQKILTLMEPCLIIFMSLVVFGILIALVVPLMNAMNSI